MSADQLDVGLDVVDDALTNIESLDLTTEGLDLSLAMRDALLDAERRLSSTRARLETTIANSLQVDSVTLPDGTKVRRRKRLDKSQLERGKEMLWRDVLDSRVFDETTGALLDETPIDKITACWDHSVHGIRTTEMKRRGLKWGDYAETVDRGWKLEVIRPGTK